MYAVALFVLVIVLAGMAPRLMARLDIIRRAPRAALVAWQAVSLSAVIAALAVAPAALASITSPLVVVVAASLVSGAVLVRLLVCGHQIGTQLRIARARHRELIDALATPQSDSADGMLHILDHATATAYCLPGRDSRVILTQGALAALPVAELNAVLAHERAHLRGRHDLLLEYFTVIHHAMPRPLRCETALAEVRLLIEALADRAAVSTCGPVVTARALLALAAAPALALGAGAITSTRMRLLSEDRLPGWIVGLIYAYATGALVTPLMLLWLAWT